MLISKKYKFIFIHIYKNAGTSITATLKPLIQGRLKFGINSVMKKVQLPLPFDDIQPFQSHIKACEVIDNLEKELFDSYFSFAFVRNPWDWQVSLYKYALRETNHHQHELVKKLGSFEEYIKWRCDISGGYQKDFIYSSSGELLVDFVGKFEKIDTDFSTVCSHIGVSTSLPKLNASNNTQQFQQFYTDMTRDLVSRRFKSDIELFGYDFDGKY